MGDYNGEVIKQARLQRGWDQAALAKNLGCGQQAVSRWESGSSRPRRAMIDQLAALLSVDVKDLLGAAGYDTGAEKEVARPVRPLLTTLPLDVLPPDQFEQFSADLAHALYPGARVQRNGAQGHKQDGVDIFVDRPGGKPYGIQCKREKRFGPDKVRQAVAELTADVAQCHIYLSRVASPQARAEIRKHRNWELRDVEDLSRAVRLLPDRDAALHIVETYFPGYREPFLGVPAPGPWVTPDQYFRTPSVGIAYGHDWDLVGRETELAEIYASLTGTQATIALLVGRGGIGKTRLLRALCSRIEQNGAGTVRLLAVGSRVDAAHFEILPQDDDLVVIIDDVHDPDGVDPTSVAAGILRLRPAAKILLSLRPYGQARLAAAFQTIGINPTTLPTWALDDLSATEATALAAQVLGPADSELVARRLAALAPDCPLLIVLGATLIRRGQLDAATLEASSSIRTEILSRFAQALVAAPATADPELRHEVLKAIAALQPFRLDSNEFRNAIAGLTGKAFDQVMPHVRGLENSGVVLRRGSALRIVPDLLGDVVLADASLDGPTGTPLGYLDRAYHTATGDAAVHLFVNSGRIDWQIRQDGNDTGTLLDTLWAAFETEFKAGDVGARLTGLKILRRVAYFQARRSLALVRWAFENPTDQLDPSHPLARSSFAPTAEDVLHELSPVLAEIAYDMSCLPDAADLLWELAQADTRPTNQFPEHPLRLLTALAEYGPAKPISFNSVLIDAAERWLNREDAVSGAATPFDVLQPLLATEAEQHRFDGFAVVLSAVQVRAEVVQPLRDRVIELALAQLVHPELRRAIAATEAIRAATTYPTGLFGRKITESEIATWTTSFVETIDRVGQLLVESSLDPLVLVALNRMLRWHAVHSSTATKAAASRARQAVPRSTEVGVTHVIRDHWDIDEGDDDDEEPIDRKVQGRIEEIAANALQQWGVEDLVDFLTARYQAVSDVYGPGAVHSGPLIVALVSRSPLVGDSICRRVAADPANILRWQVPTVLSTLAASKVAGILDLARGLLATGDLYLQRSVASAFGNERSGRTDLLDGEIDLLRQMIASDDAQTRLSAVGAARALAHSHKQIAIDLIISARFDGSSDVAANVGLVFTTREVSWTDLTTAQACDLISQLLPCPSIDHYLIQIMLSEASYAQPDQTLEMLRNRIDLATTPGFEAYRPLPRYWTKALRFNEAASFVDQLRSLIGWLADGRDSWKRRRDGAELFVAIAQTFNEQTLAVLAEAVQAGEIDRTRAVGEILSHAPVDLVFTNVEWVGDLLGACQRFGEEHIEAVGTGLHGSLIRGGRWGTPGQPFPADVDQRDKAAATAASLPVNSLQQQFYLSLQAAAEQRIKWEIDTDALETDRRDW